MLSIKGQFKHLEVKSSESEVSPRLRRRPRHKMPHVQGRHRPPILPTQLQASCTISHTATTQIINIRI